MLARFAKHLGNTQKINTTVKAAAMHTKCKASNTSSTDLDSPSMLEFFGISASLIYGGLLGAGLAVDAFKDPNYTHCKYFANQLAISCLGFIAGGATGASIGVAASMIVKNIPTMVQKHPATSAAAGAALLTCGVFATQHSQKTMQEKTWYKKSR